MFWTILEYGFYALLIGGVVAAMVRFRLVQLTAVLHPGIRYGLAAVCGLAAMLLAVSNYTSGDLNDYRPTIWQEIEKSSGHRFYDQLQDALERDEYAAGNRDGKTPNSGSWWQNFQESAGNAWDKSQSSSDDGPWAGLLEEENKTPSTQGGGATSDSVRMTQQKQKLSKLRANIKNDACRSFAQKRQLGRHGIEFLMGPVVGSLAGEYIQGHEIPWKTCLGLIIFGLFFGLVGFININGNGAGGTYTPPAGGAGDVPSGF